MARHNDFSYSHRTSGHPYGLAMTDRREHLGFIRISKCGSNTATNFFKLRRWLDCDELEGRGVPLYAAIRNPVDRLISSIPETLKRKRLLGADKSGGVYLQVEVQEALLSLDTSSAERMALGFIDILHQLGTFDAHHEAMFKFLYAPTGHAYANPVVFATEAFAQKLPLIAARHFWLQKVRPVKSLNSRGANTDLGLPKDKKVRTYHRNHPIFRLFRLPPTIDAGPLEELLRELYRELVQSQAVREATRKYVTTEQAPDHLLWKGLVEKSTTLGIGVRLSEL